MITHAKFTHFSATWPRWPACENDVHVKLTGMPDEACPAYGPSTLNHYGTYLVYRNCRVSLA